MNIIVNSALLFSIKQVLKKIPISNFFENSPWRNTPLGNNKLCFCWLHLILHVNLMRFFYNWSSKKTVIEKTFPRRFENNKGADQLAHLSNLINTFDIGFLESVISKLTASEVLMV